jgi:uncharacterized protein (TIGR03083 family)
MIRDAYEAAARCFVNAVAQVGDAQWEQPGLGVWAIRDLVGHTSRALSTVEMYLNKPVDRVDVECPADYFLRATAALADPVAVATRGREAGQALGADPARMVHDIAGRVLARVKETSDTALLSTPVGGMRLIDYLPTRVFELAIHTLDLASALALDVTLPDTVARVTLHVLADLAAAQPSKTIPVLLAATGRGPLPGGFSILAA